MTGTHLPTDAPGERADYSRRLHAAIELVWRLGLGQGERFALPAADQEAVRKHMLDALKVIQAAKIIDAPAERTVQRVRDDVRLRALLDHFEGRA